ncbi:MAG: adenylate kinase [Betaproteobacteria bacterium]|nr:adenylate kinase [Betaproteobacteria bacterium]
MRIMLMGVPGAGKGTHAAALSEKLRAPQISTGDMLRAAVSAGDPLGREAEGYMNRGELVPDRLVIELVVQRVNEADCTTGFILDGFPRTVGQAKALRAAGVKLDVVLELHVPEAEIIERMTGRRIHPASGRIYHVTRHPPRVAGRDDATGEALMQRPDDAEEIVRKRLADYQAVASALTAYYRQWAASGDPDAPRCLRVDGSGGVATSRTRVFAALGLQ